MTFFALERFNRAERAKVEQNCLIPNGGSKEQGGPPAEPHPSLFDSLAKFFAAIFLYNAKDLRI
jgi:hypothetical protein